MHTKKGAGDLNTNEVSLDGILLPIKIQNQDTDQ